MQIGLACETGMTMLTIRNIDVALKEQLRVRATRNGRSMEAELRHISRRRSALRTGSRAEPRRRDPPDVPGAGRRRRAGTPGRCPRAIRPYSAGDRPRHPCALGTDAVASGPGGLCAVQPRQPSPPPASTRPKFSTASPTRQSRIRSRMPMPVRV